MVRMHWHVEDGLNAYVPVDGLKHDKEANVHHAMCEIELAGQSTTIQGLFTLPASYQLDGSTSPVGVLLAHGNQADTYKGKLLTTVAIALAQAGHVVMRYYCAGKEQRRLRLLEKVLDAAVTSPYARNITRWVLGGVGSGARVSASVGTRCRANVAGFLLLAYPLMEPVSVFKGPAAPDSTGPLLKLTAPVLLVHASNDALSTAEQLVAVSARIPSWDVRMVQIKGVDGHFRDPETHAAPTEEVRARVAAVALQFSRALANGNLEESSSVLPSIREPSFTPPPPPAPPVNMRPPLAYPPYHLYEQAQRMQGAVKRQLPPALLSLLALAQQHQQQQQQLLTAAAAAAPQPAATGGHAAPADWNAMTTATLDNGTMAGGTLEGGNGDTMMQGVVVMGEQIGAGRSSGGGGGMDGLSADMQGVGGGPYLPVVSSDGGAGVQVVMQMRTDLRAPLTVVPVAGGTTSSEQLQLDGAGLQAGTGADVGAGTGAGTGADVAGTGADAMGAGFGVGGVGEGGGSGRVSGSGVSQELDLGAGAGTGAWMAGAGALPVFGAGTQEEEGGGGAC